MIEYAGGRAGKGELGWLKAGYEVSEIESLRKQLLSQKDITKVLKAMRKLGIRVKRQIIQVVKRYNFDSAGIAFFHENFVAKISYRARQNW